MRKASCMNMGLLGELEGLIGLSRQKPKGQKFNRQPLKTLYFYRQMSQISLIKEMIILIYHRNRFMCKSFKTSSLADFRPQGTSDTVS